MSHNPPFTTPEAYQKYRQQKRANRAAKLKKKKGR